MPWNQSGGGSGTGGTTSGVIDHVRTDTFSPSNGQTIFALSALPVDIVDVEMSVNGVKQTYGLDFSVSGQTLTWLNTNFSLTTNDEVVIDYNF